MAENIQSHTDFDSDSYHNPNVPNFLPSNQENYATNPDSYCDRVGQQNLDHARTDEFAAVRPAVQEFGSQNAHHESPVADSIEVLVDGDSVVGNTNSSTEEPSAASADGGRKHEQEPDQADVSDQHAESPPPSNPTIAQSLTGLVGTITDHSVQSESGFPHFVSLVEMVSSPETDGCNTHPVPVSGE